MKKKFITFAISRCKYAEDNTYNLLHGIHFSSHHNMLISDINDGVFEIFEVTNEETGEVTDKVTRFCFCDSMTRSMYESIMSTDDDDCIFSFSIKKYKSYLLSFSERQLRDLYNAEMTNSEQKNLEYITREIPNTLNAINVYEKHIANKTEYNEEYDPDNTEHENRYSAWVESEKEKLRIETEEKKRKEKEEELNRLKQKEYEEKQRLKKKKEEEIRRQQVLEEQTISRQEKVKKSYDSLKKEKYRLLNLMCELGIDDTDIQEKLDKIPDNKMQLLNVVDNVRNAMTELSVLESDVKEKRKILREISEYLSSRTYHINQEQKRDERRSRELAWLDRGSHSRDEGYYIKSSKYVIDMTPDVPISSISDIYDAYRNTVDHIMYHDSEDLWSSITRRIRLRKSYLGRAIRDVNDAMGNKRVYTFKKIKL